MTTNKNITSEKDKSSEIKITKIRKEIQKPASEVTLKPENKFLVYLQVAIPTFVLFVLFFAGGFWIGVKNEDADLSFFSGRTKADDSADLSIFWKTWNLIDAKYMPASSTLETSSKDRVYGAVAGMVDSLGDPYTVFLKPKEHSSFQESIKGNFSGVGMEVTLEDGVITVVTPLKNTPAEKSGIQIGDKVIEIDGKSTLNMSLEEAVSMIRGEVGTKVTMKIIREGEKESLEISIIRDIINIPTVSHEMLENDVFLISLYNFSANSTKDFEKSLKEFKASGSNKLILDLRGNPGGFLESAVEISSYFLPEGKTIVQEEFRNGEVKVLKTKGRYLFDSNLKMVILVNKGSASASEIVAGALQEHGVATLLGTQTFGKGSVQELISVNPETSLKVTIARWLTPFGKSISDGGLTPDVLVEELPEDKKDSEDYNLFDYQLDKALEIFE